MVPKADELEALRTEVRGFYLMHGNKYNELLSNLLIDKGILLPEEINDLKDQAKKSMSLRDFYKVTDIDLFDK